MHHRYNVRVFLWTFFSRRGRAPPAPAHKDRPRPSVRSLATGMEEFDYPSTETEPTEQQLEEQRRRLLRRQQGVAEPPRLMQATRQVDPRARTPRRASDKGPKPVTQTGRHIGAIVIIPDGATRVEGDNLKTTTRFTRNILEESMAQDPTEHLRLVPVQHHAQEVERVSAEVLRLANTRSLLHRLEWGGRVTKESVLKKIRTLPKPYGTLTLVSRNFVLCLFIPLYYIQVVY